MMCPAGFLRCCRSRGSNVRRMDDILATIHGDSGDSGAEWDEEEYERNQAAASEAAATAPAAAKCSADESEAERALRAAVATAAAARLRPSDTVTVAAPLAGSSATSELSPERFEQPSRGDGEGHGAAVGRHACASVAPATEVARKAPASSSKGAPGKRSRAEPLDSDSSDIDSSNKRLAVAGGGHVGMPAAQTLPQASAGLLPTPASPFQSPTATAPPPGVQLSASATRLVPTPPGVNIVTRPSMSPAPTPTPSPNSNAMTISNRLLLPPGVAAAAATAAMGMGHPQRRYASPLGMTAQCQPHVRQAQMHARGQSGQPAAAAGTGAVPQRAPGCLLPAGLGGSPTLVGDSTDVGIGAAGAGQPVVSVVDGSQTRVMRLHPADAAATRGHQQQQWRGAAAAATGGGGGSGSGGGSGGSGGGGGGVGGAKALREQLKLRLSHEKHKRQQKHEEDEERGDG